MASSKNTKAQRFWPVLLTVLLLDCSTKHLAVEALSPPDIPHDIVGNVFRLTLAYNPGIATGILVGSRWLVTGAAIVVIGILWRAYLRTAPSETLRLVALALLTGGALGNVIDRVRWTRGVVDFVDLGVGSTRFWTFNVADVAVTAGALLLAYVLQQRPEAAIEVEAKGPGSPP